MKKNLTTFIATLTTFLLFSQDYYSDRLFVKIKNEYYSTGITQKSLPYSTFLNQEKVLKFAPAFVSREMKTVFELVLKPNEDLQPYINNLSKLKEVEYVEMIPIYHTFFTPNDPQLSSQWNLTKIQSDLAWNIHQGSTNVKIAVTDDGFLLNHEDLVNQWHVNSSEIIGNGIDDDGNGYIDDWRGWDAADNDNNPAAFSPTNTYFTHGTHVAGIVAAQTNNSTGIASIGFNCKLIPVKIGTNSTGSLTGAFQGLDYAINASNADVINMSWGGAGFSTTMQNLLNIAYSKGIICVAAAGNSSTSAPMYPASYNHVISVASTSNTDALSSFSNYGTTIDVCAPGSNIFSTLAGATNSYGNLSGTSMASPLVAGLCALMKSHNPLHVDSIENCLKKTCDNINSTNPSKVGLIGSGRINAYQALQCMSRKPFSDFKVKDTFQCISKAVRYIANSSGISPLSYQWMFPGGTPSTSSIPNPVITYSSNGYYSATLITSNALGSDTITKTNIVHIDSPKAWLNGRTYQSYNSNAVIIPVNFKGNPPYQVTLTDGVNNFTQNNIQSNPYYFSINPLKDTSVIHISNFSDSLCTGTKLGQDTIYKKNLLKDTTICITLKTSDAGAEEVNLFYWAGSTSITSASQTQTEFTTERWTCGGTPCNQDQIAKFNLSSIPSNAQITSAYLSLYANSSIANWTNQPTAGSNNAATLKRITSTWTSSSLPNTIPSTSNSNIINLNQSSSTNSDYLNIDVKNLIQEIINSGTNNGILLSLNTSNYYNCLQFYSKNNNDTAKTPKLVLCYTIPGNENPVELCKDSLEVTSAQSGWEALQSNGTWGSLSSCNYVTSIFNANSAYFPGMTSGDCLWGPIVSNPSRTYYNSSSQTSTSTSNANIAVFRKNLNIPLGAVIDSVRLWMLSDDFVDSVFLNNKTIYTTPIPIAYGQILFTKKDSLIGNAIANNFITIKAGDLGGNYGHYFRMKVYYRKTCVISSDCDTSNLNTGKVLHLNFNGNTNDLSGNNNHATNYGATPVAGKDGVPNTAYRFDSTNYMSISHQSSLNLRSLTIAAVLKPIKFNTNLCYGNCIIAKGANGAPGQWAFIYSPSDNGTTCYNRDTSLNNYLFCGNTCSSSWYIPDTPYMKSGKWNCIVFTYDSISKNAKIYVDGIMRHQWTTTWDLLYNDNTFNLLIGKFAGTGYPYYINAVIDDIRIYNRVLSQTEVKGYCGTCNTVPPPISDCDTSNLNTGKVLHLDFNGNTQDKSGNSNHATNYGATLVAGKDGIPNTAYRFNGSSNYMTVVNSSTLSPQNISICAIVKPRAFYAGTCLGNNVIDKGTDASSNGRYCIRFSPIPNTCSSSDDTNQSNFYPIYKGFLGCPLNNINNNPRIHVNEWYCVVTTYEGDIIKTYVNGVLRINCKINTPLGTNSDNIFIGKMDNSSYPYWLNGDIDDIRIYNRVITASEVKGYCGTCSTITPPISDCDTSNLNTGKILHLDFNGNTQDKSGNSNHATNYGATPVTGKDGIPNTAYRFNGSSNYMTIANNASLSPQSLTMCAIIKPRAFNPGTCRGNDIIHKGADNNTTGRYALRYNPVPNYCLGTEDTNKSNFFSNIRVNGCSTWTPIDNAPKIQVNNWYCVVSTYANDTIKTFVNGILRHTCFYQGPMGSNSSDLFIGRMNHATYPYWINADVDDIRLYNRALSASEVKGYCGTCNTINPPIDTPNCTKPMRTSINKCTNANYPLYARIGSKFVWSPNIDLNSNTIQNPITNCQVDRTFLVLYEDTAGCQIVDTFDIKVKKSESYNPISDQIICSGDSTQITIPIPATNIIWSPNINISNINSSTPFLFPTGSQTYFLQFKDISGCLQFDTIQVQVKPCCQARARFVLSDSILCFGYGLTISNTSKNATSHIWNFGNAIPSSHFTANPPTINFPQGNTYPIQLIVSNGICSDTLKKNVYVIQIKPYAGRDTSDCNASLTTTIGDIPNADWKYVWTPSTYLNNALISDPTCTIVNDSLNYIVEVTDMFSNCKGYDTVIVYTNRKIDSSVLKSRICDGDSLLFNGNYYKTNGRYFYTLKKINSNCDSIINIQYVDILKATTINYSKQIFCRTYTDPMGKVWDTSTIIYDTIRSKTIFGCDSIRSIYPVEVFRPKYLNKTFAACQELTYKGKKYYSSKQQLDSSVIKGTYSGCDSLITWNNIVIYPKPTASISASLPNPIYYYETVILTASGGVNYVWRNNLSTNESISYKALRLTDSIFKVVVIDTNKCVDSAIYTVKVIMPENCFYGIPNAFTPNGDCLNDEFIPNLASCAFTRIFACYNRWGEKVFETNKNEGWNGMWKGKESPAGVYTYYLELNTIYGIRIYKGSFTLIR